MTTDVNGYTEAQLQIQAMVRDFARREIAPGAEERDRTSAFDYGLPAILQQASVLR